MRTIRVAVEGAELEVISEGAGEPVILVQTALLAEEFAAVAREPVLAEHFRVIRYHRRGYSGSTDVAGPGSIVRDAADCRGVAAALSVDRAHVVGLSFSCAIALTLAAEAPDLVHTLTLVEPPPVQTRSEASFRAASAALTEDYRTSGPEQAVERFLTRVIGPAWREDPGQDVLPETTDQLPRAMVTFVETDMPALLAWQFTRQHASRLTQPVLHIGGSDSGQWFADSRDLMLDWFPHLQDFVVRGATHALAITHPRQVAAALARFLADYPMSTPDGPGRPTGDRR